MTVDTRHGLYQINAIVCITFDHLQILYALFLVERFPASAHQSSNVLDAAEDVFACFFADEVHDRHYLVTADDRVSHIEEITILCNLFLSFLVGFN